MKSLTLILTLFCFSIAYSQSGATPDSLSEYLELGYKYDGGAAVVNWHNEVNIPFEYGYRYLSGGANTTSNWKTWVPNNPDGESLRKFLRATKTADLTPVVTFYNIKNTLPSTGGNEQQKVVSNLRNDTAMLAYYNDFQLVMEICAESEFADDTIIVHVEPDLFGFIEKEARNNSVSLSSFQASVASSTHPIADSLPNTAVGFALTLLKLRDTYAPNVLMAYSFSWWSNGGIRNKNNILSESTVRQRASETAIATFEMGFNSGNAYGISTWDLFFFDTNGRDAAFRELVSGNASLDSWWTNPDLHNLRIWADQLNKSTGLRSMYWQIALGNQAYKTIDNTSGHYEDRITEYLLGNQSSDRLNKWAQSGVIGLLFGSGNANTTNNWDYKGDSISNGGSSGLTATVSDDDGGYFREKASEYYSNGKISLENNTFSDSQIVISFDANATTTSDVIAELHSTVNIDTYSTTYYQEISNEVFLKTKGENFVDSAGYLPDLILTKTLSDSSEKKYTVVSERFAVSDYLYTEPFQVVSTTNIRNNAVLTVRYDNDFTPEDANNSVASVIKLSPSGIAENPGDQILDASFNLFTKLDANNDASQILDIFEIEFTDWDSNIADNIANSSTQYDTLNTAIKKLIRESFSSSSTLGITSPTLLDLDLSTFKITELDSVNRDITLAIIKTGIRGEGRFKFYSGSQANTSPYALFSYITSDTIAPTVTLSDNDFDNFVSDSEVITITASFSEKMSTSPTISLSGIASNIAMTQAGNDSVWTYNWTVSSLTDSTIVTVSGTDLYGNAYQGADSIIFKNSSTGIYYVDPTNGDDATADGSKSLPFARIDVAVDSSVANNINTVQIIEGTHVISNSQSLTVQPNQELVIEAETDKTVVLSFDGLMNGIIVQDPNALLTTEGTYADYPQNITIRNLIFEGNSDYYDHYTILADHYWIQSETFKANRGSGTAINLAHGVDVTIENNVFRNFYQKAVDIRWGRYVTFQNNIVSEIAFTSLSGGAGIHRNWNYDSGFNDSDDSNKYRIDISNNLFFNVYQRIYSWLEGNGYLNMDIDEGKSIWLDGYPYDDHLVHSMKMLVNNNFVAITETDAITMKPNQGLEVSNNSIYVNASKADGFVDRPHRYGIADSMTYPGLIFENNLVQTRSLKDDGSKLFSASFNRVYESYLSGIVSSIDSNYYFGGDLRPTGIGSSFTELSNNPYQDPENGDFTYSVEIPSGIGANLDSLQPLFTKADNLNISLQKLNWEFNHIKSTQTIIDNIPGIYDDIVGNETVFLEIGTYFESDKEGEKGRKSWYLEPNLSWGEFADDYDTQTKIDDHFDRPRYSTDTTLNWDQFDNDYELILHKDYTTWYDTIMLNYKDSSGNDYTYIRNGESVIHQEFNFPSYGLTVFEIEDTSNYDITESTNNIKLDGDLLIRVNYSAALDTFDLITSTGNITTDHNSIFKNIIVEGHLGQHTLEIKNNGSFNVLRLVLLPTLNIEEVIDTVIACDSYTWTNGITYTSNNTSARDTLLDINSADSLIKILNLTINSSNTGTDVITACDSYTWIDGNTYTASNNTATHTLTNVNGCDSIVTLDLTISSIITGTDVITACDSYTWIDGNTYTANNNTATHTLTNAAGCDSVVTLDLTINNSTTATDVITACDSYTWIDGNTYTASNNTATHTLTNVNGCDSVVTLNLTINSSNTGTDVITACDSYTWIDGNTYTASNNTATHTLTNVNGCDSVVTLNLTINSSNTGTDVITACDSYTWIDGNTYTASNSTATYTLTNVAGCDSVVTLSLTINSSNTGTDVITACDSYTWIDGNTYTANNNTATHTLTNAAGCDSVVTLDLTINSSNAGTDVITACDSYTWIDGLTYTASNNSATYTLTNTVGCDSIVTLDLTINSSNTGTDVITACDSYTWIDGNTYTASNNTATHTLTNVNGCDSVVTLDLSINSSNTGTDVITACDSYTWIDGNTYAANNNTATHTLTNAAGCDSVVTLDLTINNSTAATDVITACDSYTWIDGNTYTASNNTATQTLTNVNGCDSVVTLDLTINSSNTGTDVITACDSYTWIDGNTYTTSNNTATYTLTNAAGCDSLVTLDLTINSSNAGTDVITACDSYTWIDGNTYTANNNTATHTLTNTVGCDSVVTLDLTINSSNTGTDEITACDSYTWIDGNTYTASNNTATHTLTNVNGCDSVVTLDLTIESIDASVVLSGLTMYALPGYDSYQWYECTLNGYVMMSNETNDSISITANGDYAVSINNNNCSDTSDCITVNNIGFRENYLKKFRLYPNPTQGIVTVERNHSSSSTGVYKLQIVDSHGKVIQRSSVDFQDGSIVINLEDYPAGIYQLNLINEHEVFHDQISLLK